MLFGFFFLCRASEYVHSGRPDFEKILRGVGVSLKAADQDNPERLDVQFRKNKK